MTTPNSRRSFITRTAIVAALACGYIRGSLFVKIYTNQNAEAFAAVFTRRIIRDGEHLMGQLEWAGREGTWPAHSFLNSTRMGFGPGWDSCQSPIGERETSNSFCRTCVFGIRSA